MVRNVAGLIGWTFLFLLLVLVLDLLRMAGKIEDEEENEDERKAFPRQESWTPAGQPPMLSP